MLEIKLQSNLSLSFASNSWLEISPDYLVSYDSPFVSAIGDNSLLIYGGDDHYSRDDEGWVADGLDPFEKDYAADSM